MNEIKPKQQRTVSTISYDPDVLDFISKEHIRTGYSKSYLVNQIIRMFMGNKDAEKSDT